MTEAVLFCLLLFAAATDWRRQKIFNLITIPCMVAGLWYQCWQGTGWEAVSGLLAAIALTVFPVALRGMGMGDQKLLMAVGAWTSHGEVYSLFLQSLWICMVPLLFKPSAWTLLYRNILKLAVGWAGHRQLWLPERDQSALRISYAVPLLAAFLLQHFWR